MITLNVRKQGGAAVITLPAHILKLLNVNIGDTLALEMNGKDLVLRSAKNSAQRLSLDELLQGVTPDLIKTLKKETAWFEEDDSVGREIV